MRHSIPLPPGAKPLDSTHLDSQTDDEIINLLENTEKEVKSQKNVWAFWDKGLEGLNSWRRRNVIGWVRKLGPGWTVRVLDQVESSPRNILNYLASDDLPNAVTARTMRGKYAAQHTSDMVRLPLLHKYGGIYLDVGIMIVGNLEKVFWDKISDPQSPYEVGGFINGLYKNGWGSMHNFCIVAQSGNVFIKKWHEVIMEIWKDRVDCTGLDKHPLFRGVPADFSPGVSFIFNLDLGATDLAEYSVNLLAWEKVKVSVDPATNFNGPEYIKKHVFLLPSINEAMAPEAITRYNTPHLFSLLSCPRSPDTGVDPGRQKEAETLVTQLLHGTTLIKSVHGHENMKVKPLSTLWDESGKEDPDVIPGTFGEYLRYASERIDQQREVVPLSLPPYDGPVVTGPILEP